MRFSLIIPIYNAEKTLSRCLDSILSQDFDDYEVLCIDDGSKDASLKILGEYACRDRRIRVIRQTNSGPSIARNTGLDNAQGDWVLFVDADDYLREQTALSSLQETIIHHLGSELIYFAGEVLVSEGKYHDTLQPKQYKFGYQCMEDNCNLRKCIVFGALYAQCYKRSVIEKYNLRFDADIVYGEDRLFVCTYYLNAGETIVIPDVLYTYVVLESSLMHDAKRLKRQASDNIKVAQGIDRAIQKSALSLRHLKKYVHGLYVLNIESISPRDRDWRFVFRNASTWKLMVKDILLFCGKNLYK